MRAITARSGAIALAILFSAATAASAEEIRVLFVYNKKVPLDPVVAPSQRQAVELLAALNLAIRDSGIANGDVFKLAGYEERAWDWTGKIQDLTLELELARTGAGAYQPISALRKSKGAGIVVILARLPTVHSKAPSPSGQKMVDEESPVPGISTAYQGPGKPGNGYVFLSPQMLYDHVDSPQLYGAAATSNKKRYAAEALKHFFIHEIGHVLGANHDEDLIKADQPNVYRAGFNKMAKDNGDNRAYVDAARQWASIMTYNLQWQDPIRFSNCQADVAKKGARFKPGKCAGGPGDANNAKTIKSVIPIVAKYMPMTPTLQRASSSSDVRSTPGRQPPRRTQSSKDLRSKDGAQ